MINDVMLWKTCRVLANESRLRILKRLMRGAELCVTDIAKVEKLSLVVVSQHLRLLHEHGFLKQTRKSKWMFYSSVCDSELPLTQKIHDPLKKMLTSNKEQTPQLLKLTTAFTHPRRIDIIKQLGAAPRTFMELASVCGISSRAMNRHLEKLLSRNFIRLDSETYRLVLGGSELKKALIDICRQSQ